MTDKGKPATNAELLHGFECMIDVCAVLNRKLNILIWLLVALIIGFALHNIFH